MSDPKEVAKQLQRLQGTIKGPSKQPTELGKQEESYIRGLEKREDLRDQSQDRAERRIYAKIISYLVIGWLVGVLLTIILAGFGGIFGLPFTLSNGVIFALLGTVTVNVIGLFFVVLRYLFYRTN